MTPLMVAQLKRDKADIPENVIQEFMKIFHQEMSDGIPVLLDQEAEIYARHYSLAELQSIAAFYRSDIGKKMITEAPSILKDTVLLGQVWGAATGQHAAEETIKKLRAQGIKI